MMVAGSPVWGRETQNSNTNKTLPAAAGAQYRDRSLLPDDNAGDQTELLSQARSLLTEIHANSIASTGTLVRFVACCNPLFSAAIAHAYSKVSAIYCGTTLHVFSGADGDDANARLPTMLWHGTHLASMGPDLTVASLHYASHGGIEPIFVDDENIACALESHEKPRSFKNVTVDQSSLSFFRRQVQSTTRQETTVLVVESGATRAREIDRAMGQLAISAAERMAFVFLKAGA